MQNTRIYIFVLFVLFVLCSCDNRLPGSKTMVSAPAYIEIKTIKPPYSIEVDDSTTIDMGDGFCITIPGTRTVEYPESYWITVYYINENDKKYEVTYEVTKKIFDSLEINQQVHIDRYKINSDKNL